MKKGVITVYLAITFSLILSLFLSAFEAARAGAYRVAVECALRSAILSAFAEYNKELLNRYDLMFIDLTYQTDRYSNEALAERVENRMEENLNPFDGEGYDPGADLFGRSEVIAEIKEIRKATDSYGAVMRNQAVEYMKDLVSADFIQDLQSLKEIQTMYSLTEEKYESENETVILSGESCEEDSSLILSDDEKKEVSVLSNPDVELYFLQPLDLLVMKGDVWDVSGKTFNPLDVPSARIAAVSNGDATGLLTDPVSELLFTEYCMQKSGNYLNPKENTYLRYETEYLIAGTPNDSANLSAVIHLIFGLRTLANAVSLKQDSEKMAEIEATSLVLSVLTRSDPKTIANTLVFLWAAAEATYDTEDLLKGKKVELIKEAKTFHTSLAGGLSGLLGAGASFSNMALVDSVDFSSESTSIGEYSSGGKTMGSNIRLSYEDYLRLFLMSQPEVLLGMRMMDVMELNIRQTKGNDWFRMDQCVDLAEFYASVQSSFGVNYTIRRRYGYDF